MPTGDKSFFHPVEPGTGERVGAIPYGYRLAGDGTHLMPVLAERKVLAQIAKARKRGKSYARIADDLYAERIPTKRGSQTERRGQWYAATVRSVWLTARRREAVEAGSRDHAVLAKPRRRRAA